MKKGFTLLAALFVASNLFATIHYTYVFENAYDATRSYDLDLDGDNDFSFYVDNNTGNSFVSCLKATSYYAADGSTGSTPKAYATGAGMGTYHWVSGTEPVMSGVSAGPFAGTEKYL